MPRYRLTLAYDGTNFCGWQKQEPPAPPPTAPAPDTGPENVLLPHAGTLAYSPDTPLIASSRPGRVALRTVEGVLEQAVRAVVREPVEVLGASRTDSGVHAKGQVAAFTCEPRALVESSTAADPPKGVGWPASRGADRLALAINSRLPDDVLVLSAALAPHDFDPVSGAVSKAYSYTFHCAPTRPLWDRTVVHHIWHPRGLDVPAMNAAAAAIVGEHDFAAFAAAGHGRLTTVRTVFACAVSSPAPHRVRIDIAGSGFLWNMVRIIGGTLLQVGLGQRTPASVADTLASRNRAHAGPTLPPTGLCLEWIRYPGDPDPAPGTAHIP